MDMQKIEEREMKKVDLMVFDFDGTLAYTAADLIEAANYTRNALGLPILEESVITSIVSNGTEKLMEKLIGPELRHRFDEAMNIFLTYYNEHLLDKTTLYPGVVDILDFFIQKRKIIITNKRCRFVRRITETMRISDYFEDIIGRESTLFRKPDPRLLLPFLERFKIPPSRTVVLGDGVDDIRLASNTGVSSCAMLNGLTSRDVLLSLNPDFVCENMLELKEIFC